VFLLQPRPVGPAAQEWRGHATSIPCRTPPCCQVRPCAWFSVRREAVAPQTLFPFRGGANLGCSARRPGAHVEPFGAAARVKLSSSATATKVSPDERQFHDIQKVSIGGMDATPRLVVRPASPFTLPRSEFSGGGARECHLASAVFDIRFRRSKRRPSSSRALGLSQRAVARTPAARRRGGALQKNRHPAVTPALRGPPRAHRGRGRFKATRPAAGSSSHHGRALPRGLAAPSKTDLSPCARRLFGPGHGPGQRPA